MSVQQKTLENKQTSKEQQRETIALLKELYSGAQRGVKAASDIRKQSGISIFTSELELLEDNCADYAEDASKLLFKLGEHPESISAISRAFMWGQLKLNTITGSDASKMAKLCIEGCNMGITDITKILNDCPNASQESKKLCENYTKMLDESISHLKEYL